MSKNELNVIDESIKRRGSVLATAQMLDNVQGLQSVAALLKDGADVNARGNSGQTPTFAAAANALNPALSELIAAKADVNAAVDGITPIQNAAMHNNAPGVTLLLAAGAEYDEHTFNMQIMPRGLSYTVAEALAKGLVSLEYILRCVPTFMGMNYKTEPGNKGVRVLQVLSGQPASRAGIRVGDLITAVADSEIKKQDEFDVLMKGYLPCDKITLRVQHHDEEAARDIVFMMGAVGYSLYQLEGLDLMRQRESARLKALHDSTAGGDDAGDEATQQTLAQKAQLSAVIDNVFRLTGGEDPQELLKAVSGYAPKLLTDELVADILKQWKEEESASAAGFPLFVVDCMDSALDEEAMEQLLAALPGRGSCA